MLRFFYVLLINCLHTIENKFLKGSILTEHEMETQEMKVRSNRIAPEVEEAERRAEEERRKAEEVRKPQHMQRPRACVLAWPIQIQGFRRRLKTPD